MLPADAEETCDKLQIQMQSDMEREAAKKEQRIQGYFNANGLYPYNYYGMNYYNTGFDQGVYNMYVQKVQQIANEAMESRRRFNKNLYSLVNNYLDLGIPEEQVNQQIEGYTYTIPGSLVQEEYNQRRFDRLVPFDNSGYYRAMDAQISKIYQSVYTGNGMNDLLNDCGMLIVMDKLEEQFHKNRDMSGRYNRTTYQNYLREFALRHEMKAKEEEIAARQAILMKQVENGDLTGLPETRDQAISMLFGQDVANRVNNLAAALGSDHPMDMVPIGPRDNYGTPVMTISNAVQEEFEMRRNAFVESINSGQQSYAQQNYQKGVT